METVTFSINQYPLSINEFHRKFHPKIEYDDLIRKIKTIKIIDGIKLKSQVSTYTFNIIYFTMLVNHLLNLQYTNQRFIKINSPFIYKNFKSINLHEPVIKLLELIDKKNLINEFINLSKKYDFSIKPESIYLYQIMELLDIEKLNNRIYYFR